ncbi:hypothetical protein C808_01080 [Lachnospiraceae bacterium M18-1]|nr:hypothetical protein C808_01080 [Lachnospiraceae bacterium M18-1]
MLIHWQFHQEYLHFLHETKIHLDSSQRTRLRSASPFPAGAKAVNARNMAFPTVPAGAISPTRMRTRAGTAT